MAAGGHNDWIDCINQDLHFDEVLRFIFYNGRHLKVCLMITLQVRLVVVLSPSPQSL
jgi:hypothetical protein